MVGEVFEHSTWKFRTNLLHFYNSTLETGFVDPSWRRTLFSMLPQSGDRADQSHWRPMAILRITYRMFARLLHHRLGNVLDADQVGVRKADSKEYAFAIFECECGKSVGYRLELWCGSLNLKKTFDRIEYHALSDALHVQNVLDKSFSILSRTCSGQEIVAQKVC